MTVVLIRDSPTHRHQIHRQARRGDLVRVLPGTYLPTESAHQAIWLAAAACAHYRDAVIVGHAATYLNSGGQPPTIIEVATQGTRLRSRGPFRFTRARIPDHAVHTGPHGIRLLTPALAAIIDAAHDNGRHLYEALRTGQTNPTRIAHTWQSWRRRPGNTTRTRWVTAACRDTWSVLEAQVQQILITAGIQDWIANAPIRTRSGRTIIGDIVFKRHKLVIEVDGYTYHHGRDSFDTDRYRHNHLIHTGYTVLHVTSTMLTDPHYLPHLIRDTLNSLAGHS